MSGQHPVSDAVLAEDERIAHTGLLARFVGHCARHPWRVVFTWLGIFALLIGLNVAFHGKLINDFKIPGSDTQKATDLITAKFGGHKGAALRVVVASKDGQPLDAAAIGKMLVASKAAQKKLAEDPTDVADITSPLAPDSGQISDNDQIGFFDVQFDKTGFQLERKDIVALEDQLRAIGAAAGIQTEFTGEAESAPPTQGISDIIGLVAAFFILMVLFRALVPTVIPLLFAIFAVMGAFLILFLAARLTHFNTVTEILVPMIGLGVGIDYTLFIVTRFRQFLHDGLSPQEAAAAAGATAGRAVLFAGLTVAISITGLALIGLDFITKLGIGSALGVLTAVLLATSMLPAVLALLGHKIDRGRLGMKSVDESREGQAKTPVAAWGRFVSRNAKIVLPVVTVVLLLLASPVIVSRLGLADAGTAPKDQTTRKAYDLLSSGFGPGFTEPIPVVIDLQLGSRRGRQDRGGAEGDAVDHAGRQARLQREEQGAGLGRDRQRLREVRAPGSEDRRHRLGAPPHGDPGRARRLDGEGLRVGNERGLHGHRPQDLLERAVVPALHHRDHVPRPRDGVPLGRDRPQGGADDAAVGARRLRRAHLRRPGGPRDGPDRARPHRPDRELRAADRVRDPVRALDGLRGVPDEPHPRGARARRRTRSRPSRTASPASAA